MELATTQSLPETAGNTVKRACDRSAYKAPIMISTGKSETYHRATMLNYSEKGMYFESDVEPKPGSKIKILMERQSPSASGPETFAGYRAKVIWTREILDNYTFYYGVGVAISRPLM